MLAEIFKAVIITSFAGGMLTVVLAAVSPAVKRAFAAAWNYYIWLSVLIVMVLPVKFGLPAENIAFSVRNVQASVYADSTEKSEEPYYYGTEDASTEKATDLNIITGFLPLIWIVTAAVLIIRSTVCYVRFRKSVKASSFAVQCPEIEKYTDKSIEVRVCGISRSPFIIGVCHPVLVLPDRELTAEQLDNILRHETVHLRRRDTLYRWFTQIVKCLHWFNPAAYYVFYRVCAECEISCDAAVISDMTEEEKMSYVNTILSLLNAENGIVSPLTTGMNDNFKMLKRRFIMIKNNKKTGRVLMVISSAAAAVILSASIFVSGAVAGMTSYEEAETENTVQNFIKPADGRISSGFSDEHPATDIAMPTGTEVKAAADGTVIFSGYEIPRGNYIIIDHGNGYTTIYAHGSELLAEEGEAVKSGDVIMKSGSTGMSTGPHLHFEIRDNGNAVDPEGYFTFE